MAGGQQGARFRSKGLTGLVPRACGASLSTKRRAAALMGIEAFILKGFAMKSSTLAACSLAVLLAATSGAASAKGCIKGAAVGAVAGHYAGHHAVLGAVGGCFAGRHMAKTKAAEQKAAQQRAGQGDAMHAGTLQTAAPAH